MSAGSIYREALVAIAKNTCCSSCREAALVAQSALKAAEALKPSHNSRYTTAFQDIVEDWMLDEGFGSGECNRVGASKRLLERLNASTHFA